MRIGELCDWGRAASGAASVNRTTCESQISGHKSCGNTDFYILNEKRLLFCPCCDHWRAGTLPICGQIQKNVWQWSLSGYNQNSVFGTTAWNSGLCRIFLGCLFTQGKKIQLLAWFLFYWSAGWSDLIGGQELVCEPQVEQMCFRLSSILKAALCATFDRNTGSRGDAGETRGVQLVPISNHSTRCPALLKHMFKHSEEAIGCVCCASLLLLRLSFKPILFLGRVFLPKRLMISWALRGILITAVLRLTL